MGYDDFIKIILFSLPSSQSHLCSFRSPFIPLFFCSLSFLFSNPTTTVDSVIDTIFPAPSVDITSSTHDSAVINYYVPLEFTGIALTCMGFGWPPPSIRWTKDSVALPTGVTSVVTTKQGRVKANLNFTTPFSASFIGAYKCELAKAGSQEGNEVSRPVQLFQGKSQGGGKAKACQEITSNSFFYHLHILNTGCLLQPSKRWVQTVEVFQNLLYRTVLSICNCDLVPDHISVIFMWCTNSKEGAVMFRGSVQTNSSSLTGTIFCTIYRWQRSGALVSVNGSLFVLDNRCSLKLNLNEEKECDHVGNGSSVFIRNTIIFTLISCFLILSIFISAVLMYVFYLHYYRKRRVS